MSDQKDRQEQSAKGKELLYALRKMRPFTGARKQPHADATDVFAVRDGLRERGMALVRTEDLALILDRYEAGDTSADPASNLALARLRVYL